MSAGQFCRSATRTGRLEGRVVGVPDDDPQDLHGVRPRVRLMWDWHAFPIWGPVVIDDLPISGPLRARLQAWSDVRTDADGWRPPGWDDQGRKLVRDLRSELGSEVVVGYFDEDTGETVWPPDTEG